MFVLKCLSLILLVVSGLFLVLDIIALVFCKNKRLAHIADFIFWTLIYTTVIVRFILIATVGTNSILTSLFAILCIAVFPNLVLASLVRKIKHGKYEGIVLVVKCNDEDDDDIIKD